MKKSVLSIILFLTVLIGPVVVWGLIGIFSPETRAGLDFDLGEKREKTQIESVTELLSSGSVLSDYAADRAPFRSVIIKFSLSSSEAVEKPYEKGIKPFIMAKLFGGSDDDSKNVSGSAFDSLFGDDDASQPGNVVSADETPSSASSNTHVHNYVVVSETAPTCTEPGEKKFVCNDCNEEYTEVVPSPGHSWEALKVTEVSYTNYGYTDYACSVCGATKRDDFVDKLVDTSYFAPNHHGEATIIGRFNWLFLDGYGNLPYYKATNIMTDEQMQEYLDKLNALNDLCNEKGIKLAIILAPNKDQVYSEYMPSYKVEDEYKRTARWVDYVKERSDIAITYPLEELKYADRYWQTYFRYDTHWNAVGGFIGTMSLYSVLGVPVTNPLELEIATVNIGKYGDLFPLGGLDSSSYPDDFAYTISYKEDVTLLKNKQSTYKCFTESDSENVCNFVLLGDSFREQMLPFLIKDFSNCTIVHRDYIESVVNDIKEADILVLQAGERYDNRLFQYYDRLMEIIGSIE